MIDVTATNAYSGESQYYTFESMQEIINYFGYVDFEPGYSLAEDLGNYFNEHELQSGDTYFIFKIA